MGETCTMTEIVRMIGNLSSGLAALAWTLAGAASCAIAQTAPAAQDAAATAGTTIWVTTTQRLKTKVYESAGLSASPILVVVVHGDSPNQPPTYQYRFAQAAAVAIPDTVVAAVLRPATTMAKSARMECVEKPPATTTPLKCSMPLRRRSRN